MHGCARENDSIDLDFKAVYTFDPGFVVATEGLGSLAKLIIALVAYAPTEAQLGWRVLLTSGIWSGQD